MGTEELYGRIKANNTFGKRNGVIIQMELLNSLISLHENYICDRSEMGVKLGRQIASDNFKLLYDIYHMQMM